MGVLSLIPGIMLLLLIWDASGLLALPGDRSVSCPVL